MNDERRRILRLLAEGKIDADQAERLIAAAEAVPVQAIGGAPRTAPKFLRVEVNSDRSGRHPAKVNVRVPMALLRAGVKLSYLMPAEARTQVNAAFARKGLAFDIDRIKPENLEEIIAQLGDLSINVGDEHSQVRVFWE